MAQCFVFGSNDAGVHGAGAAAIAVKLHGAVFGRSYGHHGNSFAIPTKDEWIETLPLETIHDYVRGFIAYAKGHRKVTFKVTRIGCGLAGYTDEQIAPMFKDAPANCRFDEKWKPILGDQHTYWGTYD